MTLSQEEKMLELLGNIAFQLELIADATTRMACEGISCEVTMEDRNEGDA